jgi:hypothetical protein
MEEEPITWYEDEKRLIAHSNKLFQVGFISGASVGILAEGGNGLLGASHFLFPLGYSAALTTVSGVATGAALISMAALQCSLVGYTAWQLQKSARKCSTEGLLKDRVKKLAQVYDALHELGGEQDKSSQITRKALQKTQGKLEYEAQALAAIMAGVSENGYITDRDNISSTQAILKPVSGHPYESKQVILQERSNKADKLAKAKVAEYKKTVHNLKAKQEKLTSVLALQLAGWTLFAVAATLLVVNIVVAVPFLLPIVAVSMGIGLLFHAAVHILNTFHKEQELIWKKTNFCTALEKIAGEQNEFIVCLKNHLESDEKSFEFELKDLELALSSHPPLIKCIDEHRDVLPKRLRNAIAVLKCEKALKGTAGAEGSFSKNLVAQLIEVIKSSFDKPPEKPSGIKKITSFFDTPKPINKKISVSISNWLNSPATQHHHKTAFFNIVTEYREVIPAEVLKAVDAQKKQMESSSSESIKSNFSFA